MKNYSQVKIGTTQAQKKLFYHLNKEKAHLDSLGETFDAGVLADRLHVTKDEVIQMQQRMSGRDLSLDAPRKDDSSARPYLQNQTDENQISADDALASSEEHEIFQREIKKVVKTLNEKETYLLNKRILGDPPLTLQEVGDHFKITRERARQLEERVILKLRQHFKTIFPDYKINVPED